MAAADRFMSVVRAALADNGLAAALPPDELQRLSSSADYLSVVHGDILYQSGQAFDYVYFPFDSLIVLLASTDHNMTLEVGLIGREGMLGAPIALGEQISQTRAVVQKSGGVARVAVPQFLRILNKSSRLRRATYHNAGALLVQAVQTALCSRFHVLEARLARCLLMTRDRLQSPSFHMTHEFLAQTLGVRRVGVTKAASLFQRHNLISYSRGDITILDDGGLEAAACDCYRVVRQLNDAT